MMRKCPRCSKDNHYARSACSLCGTIMIDAATLRAFFTTFQRKTMRDIEIGLLNGTWP